MSFATLPSSVRPEPVSSTVNCHHCKSLLAPPLTTLAALVIASFAGNGTAVSIAHATGDCPPTLNISKTASMPEEHPGPQVHPMLEAGIGDSDVFHSMAENCGPYGTIVGFNLTQMVAAPAVRVRFIDLEGNDRETHILQGSSSTDVFDGLDPRGQWELADVSSSAAGGRANIGFTVATELPAGFEPDVADASQQETTSAATAQSEEQSYGTGGGAIASSETVDQQAAEADAFTSDPGPDPEEITQESQGQPDQIADTASSPIGALGDNLPIEPLDVDTEALAEALHDEQDLAQQFTDQNLGDHIPTDLPDIPQFMPPDPSSASDGFLTAPAWVVSGKDFRVRWEEHLSRHDRVTLVDPETPDDELGSGRQNVRIGNNVSRSLRAPDLLGEHEVRYYSNDDDAIIARVLVQVADPEIEIEVPEEVIAGEDFPVAWSENLSRHDRVTIVAPGTPDDELGSGGQNLRIANNDSGNLRAPNGLGEFEVRYWRNSQERVVGRASVDAVDPEIEIEVPEEVIAGEDFPVAWSDNLSRHDRVTIVAPGTPDDELGSGGQNLRIANNDSGSLRAPDALGTFEVRYWRNSQKRIVGRAIVDVVDPDIFIVVPARVEAGSDFRAGWSERLSRHDRVTIVPAASDDDNLASGRQNIRVGNNDAGTLRAPQHAGEYEVRYWRSQQERVVGRASVEVLPDGAGVTTEQREDPPSLQELSELQQRIEELAARLEDASPGEVDAMRKELVGIGPPAIELIVELVDDGRVAPWQAAGLTGAEIAPPIIVVDQPSAIEETGTSAETSAAGQKSPGSARNEQVVAEIQQEQSRAINEERHIASLVGALGVVDAENRPDIVAQLAAFGDAAVDILLESMQQGLVEREVALEAILAIQSGHMPQEELADESEQLYRVVGVARNDALNVRESASTESPVIAFLTPDATGIERSGREEEAMDGGLWWEIVDPDYPEGGGWVNSRYLEAVDAEHAAQDEAVPEGPSVGELAAAYTEKEGYETLDVEEATEALREELPTPIDSVFAPERQLTPFAKAILMLEANEGVLPRARYRLRYGMAEVALQPQGRTLPVSLVEISRYNLGPRIRDEVARTAGEQAGSPDSFGVGPHVSYRLAMRPMQGNTSDVVGVSRAEVPDAFAEGMRCHAQSCLSLAPIGEGSAEWAEIGEIRLDFEAPYDVVRDGTLAPKAAIDLALRELGASRSGDDRLIWHGFEMPESVAPGQPFLEAVVDFGLGQDAAVEAVIENSHLMDDAVHTIWQRVASFADGSAEPPTFAASAVEYWPGRQ